MNRGTNSRVTVSKAASSPSLKEQQRRSGAGGEKTRPQLVSSQLRSHASGSDDETGNVGGRRPAGAAVSALSGTHWLCSKRRPTPLADGGPASLGSRCLRRRIRSQPACTLTSLVSPCRLSQRPWLPGLRYVACTSCIRLSSLDCGNERQWQVSPAPPSARVRGRGSASRRLRAGVPAPWLPHAARTRGVPGAGCPTAPTGARARLPEAGRTGGTGVVPGGGHARGAGHGSVPSTRRRASFSRLVPVRREESGAPRSSANGSGSPSVARGAGTRAQATRCRSPALTCRIPSEGGQGRKRRRVQESQGREEGDAVGK